MTLALSVEGRVRGCWCKTHDGEDKTLQNVGAIYAKVSEILEWRMIISNHMYSWRVRCRDQVEITLEK